MTDKTEAGQEPEAGAAAPDASVTSLDDALNAAPAASEAPKPQEAKTPKADPEAKPETQEPFWYRQAIKKEKQAREAAERRARELEESVQARSYAAPDPTADPVGYFERARLEDKLERSEDRFVDKHGEQALEEVRDWLATRPDVEDAAVKNRHPWGYAFQQYQRERLAAEIGDDPAKWREAETARIRAELEAEMAAGGGFQAQPGMAAPRIPTPAANARSAGPRVGFTGATPLGDALKRK